MFYLFLNSRKYKEIANNAVQTMPSRALGLVSALQTSNTKAPKIKPIT